MQMTPSEIQTMLVHMGKMLVSGDLSGLSSHFMCPLPVYSPTEVTLLDTPQKLTAILASYCQEVCRRGIREISPQCVNVEDRSDARAMVLVRWSKQTGKPREEDVTDMRFVLRSSGEGRPIRIELVEHLDPLTVPYSQMYRQPFLL